MDLLFQCQYILGSEDGTCSICLGKLLDCWAVADCFVDPLECRFNEHKRGPSCMVCFFFHGALSFPRSQLFEIMFMLLILLMLFVLILFQSIDVNI